MIRYLLSLLLYITLTGSAYGLVVEFREEAFVDGVSVTLGDIAAFDEDTELSRALASQTVAQAPAPGHVIELQTHSISQHFRASLNLSTPIYWRGAERTRVTRTAVQVTSQQIMGVIETYLDRQKDNLPPAEYRFIPSSQPLPFSLPAGEISWEVVPSDPDIIGSRRLSIIFKVDGRVRKNMSMRGHLEALAPVVVATGDFRKGTVLGPRHLATMVQDIGKLREPCLNPEEIIGKKLNRSVKSGHVISLHQVEFPPLVQKGEVVRMIVRQGALLLTATGVARADGKQNETIRVQNLQSNKIVYCRVTSPGVVEVTL